ncbi:phosphodiester glycosidase family protein [Prosthecobacter sp.]|uniref:phosphodiester glycosidase family protein n=1 Tax=Prosthecobacter sp. TaxID=1965333 RepID=UPI00378489A9
MKTPELLVLALMALMLAGQTPSWRLESTSQAAPLGHEAVFVVKTINGPAKVEMKLVFFDEQQCALRVGVNTIRATAKPLNQLGAEAKALAVCNGGYFHAGGDFGPAGLEIAGGRRAATFVKDRGWVGALMVRQARASLILEHEFQDAPDMSEFVQCSPWLVDQGRIAPVLLQGQDVRNKRTFLMTDGSGRWAIGICKGAGLLELAQILLTPGIITEMKVKRALNLDGGPSTGLWCRSADGREQFEKPGWAVRNAIMVVPRKPE